MINERIFRAYDIRGKVNPDLSLELVYNIGKAYASLNLQGDNKQILIGFDGRLTSASLFKALCLGLQDAGAEIKTIGLVPTPILYFADQLLKPAASIMITGSHNQATDNGFKMLSQGKPFWGEQIQELKSVVLKSLHQFSKIDLNRALENAENINVNNDYIRRILEGIIISPKLKIVWDNGNGAAGEILKQLLQQLPNQNILINNDIDGSFPNHHPDPTVAENLVELIDAVKVNNYDFGIAFDGDGDRVGVVDSQGSIISGDQLVAIFAKSILKDIPDATVIFDIKASNTLLKYINSLGGRAILSKAGHTSIKELMKQTNAILAGEMSGHMFFKDKYYGFDDAIYASLRLIDLLSREDKSLDERYLDLPKTYNTPEIRLKIADEKKFKIVDDIKQSLQGLPNIDVNDLDGMRVESEDGWWLLRASNTEGALIIRCEGNSPQQLKNIKQEVNIRLAPFGLKI
jgi:phosphomannomutase